MRKLSSKRWGALLALAATLFGFAGSPCRAVVAHDQNQTSAGGNPRAPSVSTTAGNELVLVWITDSRSDNTFTVSGGSLTWNQAYFSGAHALFWAYASTQLSSATITITAASGPSQGPLCVVVDSFTGASSLGPDVTSFTAGSASSPQTGSVTTLVANALVCLYTDLNPSATPAAGTGYTLSGTPALIGGTLQAAGEFANAVTVSPGAVSPTMTYSPTFFAALGGLAVSVPPPAAATGPPPFAFASAR